MLIIFSGKQYSGKDTAAKILMEAMPTFRRCAMGDIIKIEYAQQHGLTYEEIEANKANYRQGLIDLGNWGRNQSPDYWLDKIVAQKGDIVVTDVRIKHEYEIDLDDVQDWDYRIENNEDYSVLKQKVLKIVEQIQKSKKF